jgi:fructosamine-3-kinase
MRVRQRQTPPLARLRKCIRPVTMPTMHLPAPVEQWCAARGGLAIHQPLPGGDINIVVRLRCGAGSSAVLKQNPKGPPGLFQAEAAGLRALAVANGPRLPEIIAVGEGYLLLEDLGDGEPGHEFWADLGRRVALLHSQTGERFGFASNNFIGSTPQSNSWTADGYAFYARNRLGLQAGRAFSKGLINARDRQRVLLLAQRLPELVPLQPASLIHGDLWTGNVHAGRDGRPAIIDPATHFGWAEADLAMTCLFGQFPEPFYAAYLEVRPLTTGWRERFPIYQLYHLLNHLNLFGGSYAGAVGRVLDRFVGP